MAKVIERIPVAVLRVVIYFVLWLLVLLQFDYASATTKSIETLLQSFGTDYLSADPISKRGTVPAAPRTGRPISQKILGIPNEGWNNKSAWKTEMTRAD